jgi:hypothetical protein
MMTAGASRYPPQSSCESVTRRTQARERQVCDHCGGRFGLVTHRWWDNKFCKKVCKDAYVREIGARPRCHPSVVRLYACAAQGARRRTDIQSHLLNERR